jgi:hypothetical protein
VDLTRAFTNSKHNVGRAQEGGIPRIAISEMPKMSRTAKLIMLMTAKGMFSRIRTSTPQRIEYATDKTFEPDSTEPGKINFQGVRSLASRPPVPETAKPKRCRPRC